MSEAPTIEWWRVRAFRQRGSVDVKIRMGDRVLAVDDIWCSTRELDGEVASRSGSPA